MPLHTLTEYISYARANVHPKISDAAAALLVRGYQDMRSLGRRAGGGGKKIITATPRQLESLIRLSEALARMRLSATVDEEHVKEAIRLMSVATQTAATDPTTGAIDMDQITTGRTAVRVFHNLWWCCFCHVACGCVLASLCWMWCRKVASRGGMGWMTGGGCTLTCASSSPLLLSNATTDGW